MSGDGKSFLFLQGPHGPFFARLAGMVQSTGAQVWRAGFNRGDQAFWRGHRLDPASYIPIRDGQDTWPERLAQIIADKQITDIVLYGDTRFIHAEAVRQADAAGLRCHVFEEGYLRPYWITYERGGTNGNSRLTGMNIAQMDSQLDPNDDTVPDAPARWGDMRNHMFYGMLYHFCVLALNHGYPGFKPHRTLGVGQEFRLHLQRFMLLPLTALRRWRVTRAIEHGGFPYHLCLLQLAHDASFREHSPFDHMTEFLQLVIDGFAKGAPPHHHLILKSHPLEDGRAPIAREIARLASDAGIASRVHFVPGGKLARLLNTARTAVTVNSTAAEQALWRGLPVKAFGRAVYQKPGITSTQSLPDFFNAPDAPDNRAYRIYRRYLLKTSQVAGGFYSRTGRRQILRNVVDMMLHTADPYDAHRATTAPKPQQLQIVRSK